MPTSLLMNKWTIFQIWMKCRLTPRRMCVSSLFYEMTFWSDADCHGPMAGAPPKYLNTLLEMEGISVYHLTPNVLFARSMQRSNVQTALDHQCSAGLAVSIHTGISLFITHCNGLLCITPLFHCIPLDLFYSLDMPGHHVWVLWRYVLAYANDVYEFFSYCLI